MGGFDPKVLTEFLKDSTKGLYEKITKVAETVDKIAGGVGTALKSNFDFKTVSDAIQDVDVEAHKLINIFGQGKEHILAIKANLVDSIPAVTKLGGGFAEIVSMQESIAKSLGRNLIVNSNIYEKLYATTKVTGQDASTLTTSFKDVGMSISHIGDEMTKVVSTSRAIGVNAKDVSGQVVQNMDYMNRFNFQGGVEGVAKMAAQAVNLRISMKDTLQFAERVYNPENAIETAAALQRLGVTQSELLDPLRLMDLSINDPTELQNQVAEMTKQFVQMGEAGKFEIMPDGKMQLYEIAKALQMPYDTLTKMALGGAELEEKMKNIRFPSADKFADEDTRKLIANMAEFDKSTGQYMISFSDKDGIDQKKAVTELEEGDIEALAEASKPKEMIDLAQKSLSVQEAIDASVKSLKVVPYAYAASPITEKAMQAGAELYTTAINNISEKFSVKGIREVFKETGGEVLKELRKADGEVDKIDIDNIKKQIGKIKDYFIDLGTETIDEGWKKTKESFKNSANEFVRFFANLDVDLETLLEKFKDIFEEEGGGGGGGEKKEEKIEIPKEEKIEIPKGEKDKEKSKTLCGGRECKEDEICEDNECVKIGKAKDLVSYPNSGDRVLTGEFGEFSLDKRDMIIAGDPNKLLGQSDKDLSNFIQNLLSKQQGTSMDGNIKIDGNPKITLDINVNSPQNITKDEMMNYLQDKGVVGLIYSQMQELMSNFNRTIDYSNPTEKNKKLTNDQYSSMNE